MDVLLLCGYFEPKYQEEINKKTKTWVENAANTFQQRLIKGLRKQPINLRVVSAPFIGPWPTAYNDVLFNGFEAGESEEDITYVSFNNIWGYRNISRSEILKKAVKKFINESRALEKAIIVYCPHTPFLEAAVYGKKLDKSIHIHMVVPDLPQYMNLSKKAHPIYDFFKKIDIKKMNKYIEKVDSFTLLTEYMAEKLNVGRRPYIVVEGIVDDDIQIPVKKHYGKAIAYAGKLVEAFGVKRLIDAFELIEDQEATLHICGGGELQSYIEKMAEKDKRIRYYGVVSAEKAREILQNADVLVNPRLNDDEYTRYSFPSKNIEYLLTGNKVVAYMLDGMPEEYKKYIFMPKTQSIKDFSIILNGTIRCKDENINAIDYISNKLGCNNVAKKIVNLFTNSSRRNQDI
ncbi:glycosyltransferase [Phascolarctobacterium sp.]